MKATEHPTETSLALLSILDDLDNEIVLAGGLLSAIGGLECSGWEYDGTQALALMHIKRLREIQTDLTKLDLFGAKSMKLGTRAIARELVS